MMTTKECAEAWKEVVKIYMGTVTGSKPKETMQKMIDTLGTDKVKEVLATVAAIKKHDGRIYGANRKYMDSILVSPDSVEWNSGNELRHAGLDDIHTSHINQLITELRVFENV